MEQINRRAFVLGTVAAAGAFCCCGFSSAVAAATDAKPLDVGKLSDYAADGVSERWAKLPTAVDIVRQNGKLFAVNTKCTHHQVLVKLTKGTDGYELKCPAHGARFAVDGSIVDGHGKTKRALQHFGISVDDNGHILVDKTKVFEEGDWDADGSFIHVDDTATTKPSTTRPSIK